jgi:hypothetical protein
MVSSAKSKSDFAASRGKVGAGPQRRTASAADGPATGRPLSVPAWQRERARKLHYIFRHVETATARGRTQWRAFRWSRRAWRNRQYRDGRRVRFSYSTLIRCFYHWRKHGRNRECLALNYHGNSKKP